MNTTTNNSNPLHISYIAPIGRTLLALIFVISGMHKVTNFEATQGYMSTMGAMPELLPAVIAIEIIAGVLLIIGWHTRLAALALAGFTVIASFLFHFDLQDQMQFILFMKNLSIIGGLLMVVHMGPGCYALDNRDMYNDDAEDHEHNAL